MLLLLLTACGQPVDTGDTASDLPDPAICGEPVEGDLDAWFDPGVLHEVRIELDAESRDALADDPRTYVQGNVEVDGILLRAAGVRLKGNSSFEDLDGKAAFKIKADEFCPGRTVFGLERLTLNNMVSDPSQSQELINYPLWAAAGLPAARASYAQVWLDGEAYGLYANVESMDDEWLTARFDDASGDLWEAGDGAEFDDAGLGLWEIKEGDGDTQALAAVAAALDTDGDLLTALDTAVDLDQVLAYWAWKVVVGDPDGYPWNPNDLFLYGDPDRDGRFVFAPWGFDEGWQDYVAWDNADGRLATVCLADAGCRARFRAEVLAAVTAFEAMDPLEWAEPAWALTEAVLEDDPRRPYTTAEVLAARAALREAMAGRAAVVRHDLE